VQGQRFRHDTSDPAPPSPLDGRPPRALGRAGTLYELIVTVAFATLWTAAIMLDLQR
jgi:hypothetical protein